MAANEVSALVPLDSELETRLEAEMAADRVWSEALMRHWGRVLKEIYEMQDIIDKLREKVSRQDTLNKSLLTFLRDFKKEVKDAAAADDPQELQAILDSLDTRTMEDLAAAIAQNTPAEPVADQTVEEAEAAQPAPAEGTTEPAPAPNPPEGGGSPEEPTT